MQLAQWAQRQRLSGVIPVRPEYDKATRMELRSPMVEAGCLYLPRDAHWLGEFLTEFLAFPRGRHDDQIDALSQLLEWINRRQGGLFEVDWGDDQPGGPSPDDILRRFRR
jgi:predicted phage terminase large subunit-like protein